jgi:transcriptional regulator NrdR family protein
VILCPACGSETSVKETRSHSNCIRRRRICDDTRCNHKVWTIEAVAEGVPKDDVVVIDKQDLRAAIHDLQVVLGDVAPDK